MNFKDYTKDEFLEEYALDRCPNEVELPMLAICQEGADNYECKICWRKAIEGVDFKNPVEVFREHNIAILDELRILEEQYNMLKEGREKLKEQLLKQMELHGVDKFENENMSITYVKGSTGIKFNSTKFKKDYPTIYNEYCDPAVRAASIRFKVK